MSAAGRAYVIPADSKNVLILVIMKFAYLKKPSIVRFPVILRVRNVFLLPVLCIIYTEQKSRVITNDIRSR